MREVKHYGLVMFLLGVSVGVLSMVLALELLSSPPPSFLSAQANQSLNVSEWKPGDEIAPFPFIDGKRLDCDDAALYSYLWLDSFPSLKVQPMYGILSWWENDTWIRRAHVWLKVSDNETTLIYDYGVALPEDFYKGRRISYAQLLMYAHADY